MGNRLFPGARTCEYSVFKLSYGKNSKDCHRNSIYFHCWIIAGCGILGQAGISKVGKPAAWCANSDFTLYLSPHSANLDLVALLAALRYTCKRDSN